MLILSMRSNIDIDGGVSLMYEILAVPLGKVPPLCQTSLVLTFARSSLVSHSNCTKHYSLDGIDCSNVQLHTGVHTLMYSNLLN